MSRFNIPAYPAPDAALVATAIDNHESLGVLADHLEEIGHPLASEVRRQAGRPSNQLGVSRQTWLTALLSRKPNPSQYPLALEDVPVLFARGGEATGLTSRERLEAFLRVQADGRRGVVRLRERQEAVRERLKRGPAGLVLDSLDGRKARGCRRAVQWIQGRDTRRATASGDGGFAVAVGESYHRRIKSLYTSARASVVYGRGGAEGEDDTAYSKSYRNRFGGARWRNAGARVVYAEHPRHRGAGTIAIETSRGTEVCRVTLPADRDSITFVGLLDNDLWATKRVIAGQTVLTRFGLGLGHKKRGCDVTPLVKTGISLLLPTGQWEHGQDISDCRREARRKIETAKARAIADQSDRPGVLAAARLLARHCPDLVEVVHADRQRVGYCDAGTAAFLGRHGLAGVEVITATALRATGAPASQIDGPIKEAALRLARELFAATAITV